MNRLGTFIALLAVLLSFTGLAQTVTWSGQVKDGATGEPLGFATVFIKGSTLGTSTNTYGYFSLTADISKLPKDSLQLGISFLGYETFYIPVSHTQSAPLNVELNAKKESLKAVEVVGDRSQQEEEVHSTQMSTIRIPMKQIRHMPAIGGEVDIIKVMQLLPGISGGIEGTTGMFVRGGDADQNLVLMDEATVYEYSHLFGFFSIFNTDAVKDITVIKGGFPAEYGGRLSSIFDVTMKEGNAKKLSGSGGVGLLSSRLTVEGPMLNKKASFVVSGRRTYIDQVVKLAGENIPYYFYDLNGKFRINLSKKDFLRYSIYYGKDVLAIVDREGANNRNGFGFDKRNLTNTLSWNHIYNKKLFSKVSFFNSFFDYQINGRYEDNQIRVKSDITDYGLKTDYQWYRKSDHTVKFGALFTHHIFKPNLINTQGEISEYLESQSQPNLTFQEYAAYGQSEHRFFGSLLAVNAGLRFSASNTGKKWYAGIEPRINAKYSLTENDVVKASYSRMNQYMHRVSSSAVALPTDMWYPITEKVKPLNADQIAVGYEHLFKKPGLRFSFESYYKWMNNLIEYREGANLILNNEFEDELIQGSGDAYGFEFLLKRNEGRIYGWVAYTLSWSTRDFDELNGGKQYFARYDRRHDVSVALNFKITKRLHFSTIWVYATGSRFTAQTGQYLAPNPSLSGVEVVPIYSDRNAVKMSDSHRLDVNLIIKPKEKANRKWYGEWHIGAYNVYNRATPYQIEIVPRDDGLGYKYSQPGLFGFLPSIAYNYRF
ncbi:TonB-dependent receptor [bacterium SCSIO 12741]|nr:TonB-dependent receptor [bacterium SCSIO 12741]